MKNLIPWLRKLELLARNVYHAASEHMSDDQEFAAFLDRMSEDEYWHYHIIGSASQYLMEMEKMPVSAVKVDLDTQSEMEARFAEVYQKIEDNSLSKKKMVRFIADTEFAEWNHVFVYVMNTLKQFTPMFEHVAATIDAHKTKAETFLANLPEELRIVNTSWKLPKIWDTKILIVEKEIATRHLLSEVLADMGSIHNATDGLEALELLRDHFYNLVVSDIDISHIDGVKLFKNSVEANPRMRQQFLFTTNTLKPDLKSFFQANRLPYLEKPFSLNHLARKGREIIEKSL